MRQVGLRLDDPRLAESLRALEAVAAPAPIEHRKIAYEEFRRIIKPNILVIERALKRSFVIPDFEDFSRELTAIYERTQSNREGRVADYIPQLGRVAPELYGVSLCTIDGQRLSIGDAGVPFCVQSSSKPVVYCIALEDRGEEIVHRHMGCEPSGRSFNELTLNKEGRPHNPMINAGAIMSGSLIKPDLSMADRFDYVLDMWGRLAGGPRPGFSNPVYLSERRTADRNFALGYFMRENGAFPPGIDLVETLEFYFQCCSLEVTTDTMAVVAATLANGGVCPLTGVQVFRPDTVQKCLSLMYSCGMYDFSGEWAFRIGLPAKSGVSGVIMVVVPNVMGVCTFSPRLDSLGNSVRGIDFCREMIGRFNFHNYDNLVGGVHGKKDPRLVRDRVRRNLLVDLCWASSEGDLTGIRRLIVEGVNLDEADYDGRTALHLAASEGQARVVEYFVGRGVALAPVDRGGRRRSTTRGGRAEDVVRLSSRRSSQHLDCSQPGDGGSYGTGFHLVTMTSIVRPPREHRRRERRRSTAGRRMALNSAPPGPRILGAEARAASVYRAQDTRLGRDVAARSCPRTFEKSSAWHVPSGCRFSPRRAGSRSHQTDRSPDSGSAGNLRVSAANSFHCNRRRRSHPAQAPPPESPGPSHIGTLRSGGNVNSARAGPGNSVQARARTPTSPLQRQLPLVGRPVHEL